MLIYLFLQTSSKAMHDNHPSYEKAAVPGKKVVFTKFFRVMIEPY